MRCRVGRCSCHCNIVCAKKVCWLLKQLTRKLVGRNFEPAQICQSLYVGWRNKSAIRDPAIIPEIAESRTDDMAYNELSKITCESNRVTVIDPCFRGDVVVADCFRSEQHTSE